MAFRIEEDNSGKQPKAERLFSLTSLGEEVARVIEIAEARLEQTERGGEERSEGELPTP